MSQTSSSETKEQFVHAVFESIAPKYDMMNDLLSFRRHKAWRKFTMAKMNMSPGDTALDLCCGTCDWTISMAEASGGPIIGLDFSERMLEFGRRKVKERGLESRITLVQGNAMELPFDDNRFDYVTIGFGLRNVPDIHQVLREMRRVVKPGGRWSAWNCPSLRGSRSRDFIIFIFKMCFRCLANWWQNGMSSTNGCLIPSSSFLDARSWQRSSGRRDSPGLKRIL